MAGTGGRREGAGRKSKAEETGLVALLAKCASEEDRQGILKQLVTDCKSADFHERQESRKLYLAYVYGKPTEKHEHGGMNGEALEIKVIHVSKDSSETD